MSSAPIKPLPNVDVEDFWERVNKDGCWRWTGATNGKGYGQVTVDGVHYLAHRIAYSLAKGSVPDGLLVCHHCDNPICVRPSHLFVGTHRDNAHDMIKKGRRGFSPPRTVKLSAEERLRRIYPHPLPDGARIDELPRTRARRRAAP